MPKDLAAANGKLIKDIHQHMSERVAQYKMLRGGV